jgi:hypothetical protein
LSDEVIVWSWVENPCWQYFCGEEYFQHQLPIDPSQMTRFRTRLGHSDGSAWISPCLGPCSASVGDPVSPGHGDRVRRARC